MTTTSRHAFGLHNTRSVKFSDETIFLLGVTGATGRYDIAGIVATAFTDRDDVIHRQSLAIGSTVGASVMMSSQTVTPFLCAERAFTAEQPNATPIPNDSTLHTALTKVLVYGVDVHLQILVQGANLSWGKRLRKLSRPFQSGIQASCHMRHYTSRLRRLRSGRCLRGFAVRAPAKQSLDHRENILVKGIMQLSRTDVDFSGVSIMRNVNSFGCELVQSVVDYRVVSCESVYCV